MEVKRALISDSHTGEIVMKEKTKTESSHRKVRLSDDVIELLEAHKQAQEDLIEEVGEDDWQGFWKGEQIVFTNEENGNWIYPTNVTRTFNRILEEAGLDTDYQFHDLRSSYISLMHHLGADIEDISEAVGHSTSDVTKRIYRKTVPGVAKEDANRLSDEILGG
jgi:integrase